MGFFSNMYTKEGPGVRKDQPPKKGIPRFFEILMRDYGHPLKVNFLFLLCCLPMVTVVLFGLLFFVPIVGAALGAGIGALTGAIVKHGVDKDFQDRVRNLLSTDDSAAVFMVVDEMTTDKFIDAIRPFGGDVLQTSLSIKDEEELKHELFKN